MAKEDYVTEFLRERFPNGVDEYGEEVSEDEDLGASLTADDLNEDLGTDPEMTVTDATVTLSIANRKRFPVVVTVLTRTTEGKRKWKPVARKRIQGGVKELFSMAPGKYRIRVVRVMRSQRVKLSAGNDAVMRIG